MIRFKTRAERFQAEVKVFLRLSEELQQLKNERGSGFPGCLTCNLATYDLVGRVECRSCVLDWEWAREIETKIASLERRVLRSAGRESCPGGVSESQAAAFEAAEMMEPR
jgi:hypothetical protein